MINSRSRAFHAATQCSASFQASSFVTTPPSLPTHYPLLPTHFPLPLFHTFPQPYQTNHSPTNSFQSLGALPHRGGTTNPGCPLPLTTNCQPASSTRARLPSLPVPPKPAPSPSNWVRRCRS